MGRRTYEGFAPVWPTRSGDPYSDRINSMPKYVVSSTLKDPEWNKDLLYRDTPTTRFRLEDAKPLENGLVVLSYTVASA
jgi:dihydrofolate reductase